MLVALGAIGVVSAAGASSLAVPKLHSGVKNRTVLRIKNDAGQRVQKLHEGTYKWVVRDSSKVCGFALSGPNVQKLITTPRFRGTKSATITLITATYRYGCGQQSPKGLRIPIDRPLFVIP